MIWNLNHPSSTSSVYFFFVTFCTYIFFTRFFFFSTYIYMCTWSRIGWEGRWLARHNSVFKTYKISCTFHYTLSNNGSICLFFLFCLPFFRIQKMLILLTQYCYYYSSFFLFHFFNLIFYWKINSVKLASAILNVKVMMQLWQLSMEKKINQVASRSFPNLVYMIPSSLHFLLPPTFVSAKETKKKKEITYLKCGLPICKVCSKLILSFRYHHITVVNHLYFSKK